MRRFEFVEGGSAKFWEAGVEGARFVVVYGRLGTTGQRKEKEFASAEAAERELSKKIAEKVREGYNEVAVGAGAKAPAGAKGAAAASAKLALPPRYAAREATPEGVARAAVALRELEASLGGRSWRVGREVRRARRALAAIAGVDPAKAGELGAAFDAVMARVGRREGGLSLPRALELLGVCDVAAFSRAVEGWRAQAKAPRGVGLLASEIERLGEVELAFRLGVMLVERPGAGTSGADAGLKRRWQRLAPLLEGHLLRGGSTLKKHLAGVEVGGDVALAASSSRLRALV